jgi:hypothetical protein
LRWQQDDGVRMMRRLSDEFTVPLCALHHDEVHRSGPERPWWESQGIDPEAIAAELWAKSRMPSALGMSLATAIVPKPAQSSTGQKTNGGHDIGGNGGSPKQEQ